MKARFPKQTMYRRPWQDYIIEKLGRHCTHCDSTWELEIDHIIPIFEGGLDEWDNLHVLCESCHFIKSQSELRARIALKEQWSPRIKSHKKESEAYNESAEWEIEAYNASHRERRKASY